MLSKVGKIIRCLHMCLRRYVSKTISVYAFMLISIWIFQRLKWQYQNGNKLLQMIHILWKLTVFCKWFHCHEKTQLCDQRIKLNYKNKTVKNLTFCRTNWIVLFPMILNKIHCISCTRTSASHTYNWERPQWNDPWQWRADCY